MWEHKLKSDGRYKARPVVDGRQQDPSTYGSIASPTMKLTSMRILLALAAKNQWQIYADDAHMAFLNAMRPPDKPVYAQFPDGYRDGSHGKCLLLRRCLYGLHDSPQHWYDEMRKFVVDEYGLTSVNKNVTKRFKIVFRFQKPIKTIKFYSCLALTFQLIVF